MIPVSNAVGWIVFMPTTWVIIAIFGYVIYHIRNVLRTQDILISLLIGRNFLDTLIILPIVIDYVINIKTWFVSACRGVIWFEQFSFLSCLGLVASLIIDIHLKLSHRISRQQPSYDSENKLSVNKKLICLTVLLILAAVLAGFLPAMLWTRVNYRNNLLGCTYMPFQQNFDYAVFILVIAGMILFFTFILGLYTLYQAKQIHIMARFNNQEVITQDVAVRRRSNRRLKQNLRVAFFAWLILFIFTLFPAIIINIHGLYRQDMNWEPLIAGHYWMSTFEALLFPIILFCVSSRYRHPLNQIFDRVFGTRKPDHVCAQEKFDRDMMRQLRLTGNANVQNDSAVRGPYSLETHSNPICENADDPPMIERTPSNIYQNENMESGNKRFPNDRYGNKTSIKQVNQKQNIPVRESYIAKTLQSTQNAMPPSKSPYENEVANKTPHTAIPQDRITTFGHPQNNDDVISLRDNEEIKEKTIVLDDDQEYSPTSDLTTPWDDYSSVGDTYNNRHGPTTLNARDLGYNDPRTGGLKPPTQVPNRDSYTSSVDSFWLTEKELEKDNMY